MHLKGLLPPNSQITIKNGVVAAIAIKDSRITIISGSLFIVVFLKVMGCYTVNSREGYYRL